MATALFVLDGMVQNWASPVCLCVRVCENVCLCLCPIAKVLVLTLSSIKSTASSRARVCRFGDTRARFLRSEREERWVFLRVSFLLSERSNFKKRVFS